MNTFATLAVLFCACLIGNCHGGYGGGGHGGYVQQGSYGQRSNGGAASAASSAAAAGNQRPVEIIAGGPRGGYGHGQEILRPIQLGYGGHSQRVPQHGSYGRRSGYGPRWTVQPAGATLLYPGQNNYRAYVSPPEYTKVVLPIRPAEPVAKLYIPENRYGSQQNYGSYAPQQSYNVEGPRY
ncbi:chorion protein S19 [Drosophila guanche]|uniref:Blast:Chorion protein S19 n=1 Tax=Drosophila guanche TaxID=7266 RepID=A0A3B0J6G4_DROGU|nr:chorion protein S19 [Drosophila guanche]SPP77375.1 blast:Chorion protein S19 [Drosophila guanche]